eukprot:gene12841-16682_t
MAEMKAAAPKPAAKRAPKAAPRISQRGNVIKDPVEHDIRKARAHRRAAQEHEQLLATGGDNVRCAVQIYAPVEVWKGLVIDEKKKWAGPRPPAWNTKLIPLPADCPLVRAIAPREEVDEACFRVQSGTPLPGASKIHGAPTSAMRGLTLC